MFLVGETIIVRSLNSVVNQVITVKGRGDMAVLGLQDYYQMKSELELLGTRQKQRTM